MIRQIKKIKFDCSNDKITVIDNLGEFTFYGKIKDYCPRILERWGGYIDRIRQEFDEKQR